jgi:hypothetical protein
MSVRITELEARANKLEQRKKQLLAQIADAKRRKEKAEEAKRIRAKIWFADWLLTERRAEVEPIIQSAVMTEEQRDLLNAILPPPSQN